MPNNTTSSQDKIIREAEQMRDNVSDKFTELLEIIDELDDKLTDAKNKIEELESL